MPLKHWKIVLVLGIGLLILSYFYLDQPIALYFQNLSPSWRALCDSIAAIASPWWHILLWLALYYFLRFPLQLVTIARKTMLIAISINVASVFSSILKNFLGRARPELFFSQNFYGFHLFSFSDTDYMSFPSGHAVTITAIMASLACFYPRLSSFFLLFALGISFCRIVVDAHYLSDLIGGMLLGLLVAHFVYLSMRKEIKFD
ncbi:MAG TPA: phosphatase PAP2 family protein [Rhabdochlamydiaceae bacterium]|nr:phosphatase PAP2 family protein [Rhabdochlamydiaceae bacterium]